MTCLDTLKKLAQEATPGPWEHELRTNAYAEVGKYNSPKRWQIIASIGLQNCAMNAAYIAALSPERVLAMIAVIEAAKAMRVDPTYRSGYLQAFDEALAALEKEQK